MEPDASTLTSNRACYNSAIIRNQHQRVTGEIMQIVYAPNPNTIPHWIASNPLPGFRSEPQPQHNEIPDGINSNGIPMPVMTPCVANHQFSLNVVGNQLTPYGNLSTIGNSIRQSNDRSYNFDMNNMNSSFGLYADKRNLDGLYSPNGGSVTVGQSGYYCYNPNSHYPYQEHFHPDASRQWSSLQQQEKQWSNLRSGTQLPYNSPVFNQQRSSLQSSMQYVRSSGQIIQPHHSSARNFDVLLNGYIGAQTQAPSESRSLNFYGLQRLEKDTAKKYAQRQLPFNIKTNPHILRQRMEQVRGSCGRKQVSLDRDLNFSFVLPEMQEHRVDDPQLVDNTLLKRNFRAWLTKRKRSWRKTWNVWKASEGENIKRQKCEGGYHVTTILERGLDDPDDEQRVTSNFWTYLGFLEFDEWLSASKSKWKRQYSWNREKKCRLEQETEKVVQFPSSSHLHLLNQQEIASRMATFEKWLRVRKQQWKIQSRKRQRLLTNQTHEQNINFGRPSAVECAKLVHRKANDEAENESQNIQHEKEPYHNPNFLSNDAFCIDVILEDLEERKKAASRRATFDLSLVFQPGLGMSDDVVGYIFEFLPTSEHGTLLCLNKQANEGMKERQEMWKSLCPSHWNLPRRPRQPWHSIYLNRLKLEYQKSSKLSDDILEKAVEIMLKSDACHKIERLVTRAEKKFNFQVNYTSGVVLERNSLLNIATIYQRCKTVKWLIDTKGADLESMDRGKFTPLLNAAWTGNKYLVRSLLSRGADRNKIGLFHYTQGIAPVDSKGLDAEGWAKKRGYHEVAKTIKQGI